MSSDIQEDLILDQYQQISKLGSGTFGNVYKCLDLKTGEFVAIKKLKKVYKSEEEAFDQREIQFLQHFNHPNIVSTKRIELSEGRLYMVFEHLDMNLTDFMKDKQKQEDRKLTEEEIKIIMKQVFLGLDYLHSRGYVHRDLKPENFIISLKQLEVKMIDFGTVRNVGNHKPPFTTYVSTRWYRAPEMVLRASDYGPAVDIFAAGCVMAELITGQPLFPGTSELDQLETIFKILGTPTQEEWKEGYSLANNRRIQIDKTIHSRVRLKTLFPDLSIEGIKMMKRMLEINPNQRPTARQILNKPYFAGVQIKTTIQKSPLLNKTVQQKQADFSKTENQEKIRIRRNDINQKIIIEKKRVNDNSRSESFENQKYIQQDRNSKERSTESSNHSSINQQRQKQRKVSDNTTRNSNDQQVDDYSKYLSNYVQPKIDPNITTSMKQEIQKQRQQNSLWDVNENIQSEQINQNNKIDRGDQWNKGAKAYPMRREQPNSFADRVDQQLRRSSQVESNFQYSTGNNQINNSEKDSQQSPTFLSKTERFKPDSSSMLGRVGSQSIFQQPKDLILSKKEKPLMNLSLKIEKRAPNTLQNSPLFSPLQQNTFSSVNLARGSEVLFEEQSFRKQQQQQEEKIEPFLLRNDSFGNISQANKSPSGSITRQQNTQQQADSFFNFNQNRDSLFSPFKVGGTTNGGSLQISPKHSSDSNHGHQNDQQNLINKYSNYVQNSQNGNINTNKIISPGFTMPYGKSNLDKVVESREEYYNHDVFSNQKNQYNPYKNNYNGDASQKNAYNKGNAFINNAQNIFNSPGGGMKQFVLNFNNQSNLNSRQENVSNFDHVNQDEAMLNSILSRYKGQIQI